jgi:hypothetical protein
MYFQMADMLLDEHDTCPSVFEREDIQYGSLNSRRHSSTQARDMLDAPLTTGHSDS